MAWINGLNGICAQTQTTDADMDSIENAYSMLPGVWVRGSRMGAALLHITSQAGKEAQYAQATTTYIDQNIYQGTWRVSRPYGELRPTLDGHTPLILSIGPLNSPAGLEGKIVRLNDDWLVVELPDGQRPGYKRARDQEAMLAEWRERIALQADKDNL